MFVSDANFFESDLVKLRVMNVDGELCQVEVEPSETIENLTFRVVNIFLKLDEPSKSRHQFKLVAISSSKVLTDDRSVASEGLKNDDEILLVPRRQPPSMEPVTDQNTKGPKQNDIDKATAKLKEKVKERRRLSMESSTDFQSELKKVIISIVEAAARVLAHTPQANQIIELMREKQYRKSDQMLDGKGCAIISERNEAAQGSVPTALPGRTTRRPPTPDPSVVARFVDMGFTEDMVLHALRIRRMNQEQALEWLLENLSSEAGSWSTADDDEVDLEDDADLAVVESVESQASWANDISSDSLEPDQDHFLISGASEALGRPSGAKELFPTEVEGNDSEQSGQKSWSAAELLRSFEAFKKHQFRPSPKAMSALLEMGFSEDKVIEALKATGNSQVAACEWLLMHKKAGASSASSSSSWEEADEGLDPNSPAYKAILSEPLVQLSLTNPKLLLAYLSILETPSSVSAWINDVDASPVLNQIFKTYNAEKYSIQTPTPEGEDVASPDSVVNAEGEETGEENTEI
ncbi:ubiquitin-associated domain-containing protein 1 [Ischnura elegans]|uniref:ubiquitin-associated domain-containing protein 1 n=1 Tax=Ischnura elegans TaxID=197161 RepID=UPI001ED8A7BC|nr:ubiquitin-associated domain-containing protein 1 [Ischnura elegans]